ncbi:sugar-binding transcriptional regulator [Agromyces sp. CCNWLW203]|uniref:sugar-binding transcriptional regulator n=1 Tax=Agromyces sp. CCNWLW203 TaxID=3112842 RepID=UPI002F96E822
MSIADGNDETATIRKIHTVLTLHFIEGMKQSEIAARLNLSTSKVNRLIRQGRELGMVRISIDAGPFQRLVDMERALALTTGLGKVVVTPSLPGNPDTNLQVVGRAAANELLETIRDGDVIAITGGKAVSAIVENIAPDRAFDVTVVPLTGGVQGKYYTDVNHLATQLADKLGGSAVLLHAPLFAESREQRDTLMEVGSIRQVLDLARRAQVALVGIGSIATEGSSYYDLVPNSERELLLNGDAGGEFLAHLIRDDGSVADSPLNSRLVALNPAELATCPKTIGVAVGPEKVRPIRAALAGGLISSLIVDEETASSVQASTEATSGAPFEASTEQEVK